MPSELFRPTETNVVSTFVARPTVYCMSKVYGHACQSQGQRDNHFEMRRRTASVVAPTRLFVPPSTLWTAKRESALFFASCLMSDRN